MTPQETIKENYYTKMLSKKTDENLLQLQYYDFGAIDFKDLSCDDGKVGISEVNKDDFLNKYALDYSVNSLCVILGFSEKGEHHTNGYDETLEHLIIIFDNDKKVKIFLGNSLDLALEVQADDACWNWISKESFFVSGEAF